MSIKTTLCGLDFAVIAADVVAADIDIVGFQEVDKNTTRNGNGINNTTL